MNYLVSITLTKTLPCLAEPGRIIVIGKPNRPLDEVIPYLATLPSVIAYNPETCTLTFRRPHGFMTLYTGKVYIAQVVDSSDPLYSGLLRLIYNSRYDMETIIPNPRTNGRKTA